MFIYNCGGVCTFLWVKKEKDQDLFTGICFIRLSEERRGFPSGGVFGTVSGSPIYDGPRQRRCLVETRRARTVGGTHEVPKAPALSLPSP